ncbi:MAG: hypothetical protein HY650_15930 [Acidobacteria bacterium]|nr:hypothetical protein [Acidobacteriota bacterium]
MMMICKEFQRIFDRESELSGSMRRHAGECAACGAYVREMNQLGAMLREYPRISPPPDFDAELKSRIELARRRPGWVIPGISWHHAWAALLFVGLAGGLFIYRNSGPLPGGGPPATEIARSLETSTTAPPPADTLEPAGPPAIKRDLLIEGPMAGSRQLVGARSTLVGRRAPAGTVSTRTDSDGLTLFIHDSTSRELRVIRVPSVVVGAQPILPSSARLTATETEAVY